jgi:hypothetical protein
MYAYGVYRESYLSSLGRRNLRYLKIYLTRRHLIFEMRLSFGTSQDLVVTPLGDGTSVFRSKANSRSRKGK